VRWKIAQDIGTAWLLTIPATALVAALIYKLLTRNIQ
jgi:phosphate/sulfate permease